MFNQQYQGVIIIDSVMVNMRYTDYSIMCGLLLCIKYQNSNTYDPLGNHVVLTCISLLCGGGAWYARTWQLVQLN